MRRLGFFTVAAVLSFSAPSLAADELAFGPSPSWVKAAAPLQTTADTEGPFRIVLLDNQAYLGPQGIESFTAMAYKVLNAQALQPLGNLTLAWDPARETVTVHKAAIIRGTQTIDLLARGGKFSTLRRETNLSRAVLDGTLTGLMEIPDLRVGDIVLLEASRVFRDPIIGDQAESMSAVAHEGVVSQMRTRYLWPRSRPVQWKATPFYGEVKRSETGDLVEIETVWTDIKAPAAPEDAPNRFALPATLQVSDYADWKQISAHMIPLYTAAAVLAPDSPLKEEARKIAAAHRSPEARALAALQLVETDVRYLAITMGSGGYKPAGAEETWSRRFGDCKAKTVLLIALLKELGIAAEPALVNSEGGNGLDARLPGVALFDHVIVRTEIGGKVYWLDGTRPGDRSLVSASGSQFEWALPLRAPGADLERVEILPPTRPLIEIYQELDATAGLERDGPGKIRMLMRGEAGMIADVGSTAMGKEAFREQMLEVAGKDMAWLNVDDMDFGWDAAVDAFVLEMRGKGKFEWSRHDSGWSAEIDTGDGPNWQARPRGPYADAPYSTGFPLYVTDEIKVRLPRDITEIVALENDAEIEVGGVQLTRKTEIQGQIAIVRTSFRAVKPEVPAIEALLDVEALDDSPLGAEMVIYAGTAREGARLREFRSLWSTANKHQEKDELDKAEQALTRAVKLYPDYTGILEVRSALYEQMDRHDFALADARAISRLSPTAEASAREANLLVAMGRYRPALAKADEALKADSGLPEALNARAAALAGLGRGADLAGAMLAAEAAPEGDGLNEIERQLMALGGKPAREKEPLLKDLARLPKDRMAQYATALVLRADDKSRALAALDAALRMKPDFQDPLWTRYSVNYGEKNYEAALEDAERLVAALPKNAGALMARADAHAELKAYAKASADYDAALKIAPNSVSVLNQACWYRATKNIELEQALTECSDAVRMLPTFSSAWDSRGLVHVRLGKHAEAVADYDRSLLDRDQPLSLFGRGLAKRRLGDISGGDADIAAATKLDPKVAEEYEGYGLKP